MNDYPFIKCLHPKKIRNPYTQETIIVPCGSCESCVLTKCSKDTLRCQLESMSHRYCYFVTLTYNQKSLPRCQVVPTEDYSGHYVVSMCERLKEHGLVLGYINTPIFDIGALSRKCELGFNNFGYLSRYDLQLFIKRLRKSFKDEKLRYFAVGEYGPVHFRPHYHILLWFSQPWYASQIELLVRQAWPFGRIDVSLSQGGCAQYTSGYVNSYCNLPKIFGLSQTRPFKTHSFFLGEKILSSTRKEVYESSYSNFIERCVSINGSLTKLHLWRSLKTTYFPKCKGFNLLTSFERLFAYRICINAFRYTGETSPYKAAKFIANELKDLYMNWDIFPQSFYSYRYDASFNSDPNFDRMLSYIYNNVSVKALSCDSVEDKLVPQIYAMLRVSFHFISFVCDGDLSFEKSRSMLLRIEKFYDEEDYQSLLNHFETLSKCDENFFLSGDYKYYYNNASVECMDDISLSSLYGRYVLDVFKRYNDSIKHKELNDANKMFNNL